jgi:hypothetical protein
MRPRADKPKDYEPLSMLQEFARNHRTFALCHGADGALTSEAGEKVSAGHASAELRRDRKRCALPNRQRYRRRLNT